jgi:hypothetical protein
VSFLLKAIEIPRFMLVWGGEYQAAQQRDMKMDCACSKPDLRGQREVLVRLWGLDGQMSVRKDSRAKVWSGGGAGP